MVFLAFGRAKRVSEACMKPAGSRSRHFLISCSYTETTCSDHIKVPNKAISDLGWAIHNLGRHVGAGVVCRDGETSVSMCCWWYIVLTTKIP